MIEVKTRELERGDNGGHKSVTNNSQILWRRECEKKNLRRAGEVVAWDGGPQFKFEGPFTLVSCGNVR